MKSISLLKDTNKGHAYLTLVLYTGVVASTATWSMPSFAGIAYFGYVMIAIVSGLNAKRASSTIYGKHLRNIRNLALMGLLVLSVALVIVIGSMGSGIAILFIGWVLFSSWMIYRVGKELLSLSRN